MTEQPITPEDEARYLKVMTDYNDLMRSLDVGGPVPMCHFTAMTFHSDDSYSGGDGYECEHCGHSEDSDTAWAKVRTREAKLSAEARPKTEIAHDSAPF